MNLNEFKLQPRGHRTFDCWEWSEILDTPIGSFKVTLSSHAGEVPPDEPMVAAATQLCTYVRNNANRILYLIYAHYRFAEAEEWLQFWSVPGDAARGDVLRFVDGLELEVSRTNDPMRPFDLCVTARIQWDREHGFHLIYWGDAFLSVNGDHELLAKLRE